MENQNNLSPVNDPSILHAFSWWERRRILYNSIVGITGIVVIVFFTGFQFISLPGIFFYGIAANLCYSFGFLLEVAVRHYFKSPVDFSNKRNLLFWTGLCFSVTVTLLIGQDIAAQMQIRD